jgi:voltage-gated potassium channel
MDELLLFVFSYESQAWYLVMMIEGALTLVFLIDFGYRLKTASSKSGYFLHQRGFLDLLSCVPTLRIFRVFRIVRAVRIVRRLGGRASSASYSRSWRRERSTS